MNNTNKTTFFNKSNEKIKASSIPENNLSVLILHFQGLWFKKDKFGLIINNV